MALVIPLSELNKDNLRYAGPLRLEDDVAICAAGLPMKRTIFGYKLHLPITLGGLILDFELAPANITDLQVGFDLLAERSNLAVIGDKAYISAEKRLSCG